MSFIRLFGSFVFASAAGLSLTGAAHAQSQPRAVVELYTSQGCSSCPAADKLLGELAQDSSIVALTLPVDYWDYLGWKDTLANPRHTARQRAYSHARGDREVYTPQVVVNGKLHVLGSDKTAIEQAIAKTKDQAMTVPVTLTATTDHLTVSIPEMEGAHGEVWLCALAKSIPVAIRRGENTGRKVVYSNVGRRWVKLGDWNGKAASWTMPADKIRDDGVDAAAVMIQSGSSDKPGPMLGAALANLR
jgi:hypothetical protein